MTKILQLELLLEEQCFVSVCTYHFHVHLSWTERLPLDLAEIVMDNCHSHPFSKFCYYFLIQT